MCARGEVCYVLMLMTNGRRLSKPMAIGQESFLTWKVCTATPFKVDPVRPNYVLPGRAFSIWTEWARQSSPESQVWQLLDSIRDIRWLVDVTHHDLISMPLHSTQCLARWS